MFEKFGRLKKLRIHPWIHRRIIEAEKSVRVNRGVLSPISPNLVEIYWLSFRTMCLDTRVKRIHRTSLSRLTTPSGYVSGNSIQDLCSWAKERLSLGESSDFALNGDVVPFEGEEIPNNHFDTK